jgi:hypothetical protein
MSNLSVDNIIGIQPTTTPTSQLQCNWIDVYANDGVNFSRLTSVATAPLLVTFPNAQGVVTILTATQTLTNKMNHAQNGTAGDPSYSFVGNTNMGLFRSAANTIGISTAGVSRITISDTRLTSSYPLRATIFEATSGTFPTCAFTNSTNDQTGLFFGTTTTCSIGCNGSTKFTFGSSQNTSFSPIIAPDGTNTSGGLAYSFSGSTQTGFFNPGSNRIGIVCSGTPFQTIGSGNNTMNQPVEVITGSVSNLSIKGSSFSTTGLYFESGPLLSVGVSGVKTANFETGGMKLYGSTAGNNALYSASLLGYYEESTKALTWTWGSVNSGAINVKFIRIGNAVICQITADVVVGTPSSAQQFCTSNAMDIRFRPSSTIYFSWFGYDNATSSFVNWRGVVKTTGEIELYRYQGAVTNGLTGYAYSFSWSIY